MASNTNGSAPISTIAGSAAKSTASHPIQQKLILGLHKDLALDLSYFLVYINVFFALRKAHATMYADDTAISYSLKKTKKLTLLSKQNLPASRNGCRAISFPSISSKHKP